MSAASRPVDTVTIDVNGRRIRCAAHCSVATALLNAGYDWFRSSIDGSVRGPLCGMGSCHECRVTLDGREHTRACMVLVRDDMRVVIETGAARAAQGADT